MRSAALARRGHQRRRVKHLVKALIPDLVDVAGLVPATTHALGRAVEEEQARRALRKPHSENLHHVGADVVPDKAATVNVQCVQQREDILSERGGVYGVGRLRVRVLALSEPPKVRSY